MGRIAAGGMAEIYLARTTANAGVEREVVLKRLLPELQTDHEFVQMFYDEARIASQLNHPNVAQIFELGELDGSLFISMELIRGVNLRDLLARLHTSGRTLPLPLAVRVACEALEGLHYAHSFVDARGRRLNVVHRDVSPQNMILTYEGSVKLVDFGVAKAEGKLHQTRAGLVKGKFAYMSPEQITGGVVDGRSDIFALAEVFYELLLRRHPFYAATDVDVLRAILDADPPHPSLVDPQFPRSLGDILMRALRKNREERFEDAGAMQEALEHHLLESRTPATTIMLGRFIRELFSDRISAEQRARETGDDELLIEAMTSGRAEYLRSLGKGAIPRAEARAEPSPDSRQLPPPSVDPRALPPRAGGTQGAAVGGRFPDPAMFARPPETTGSRLRNEVRGLFNDEDPLVRPVDHPLGVVAPDHPDEMPTLLGQVADQDVAQLRADALLRQREAAHDPYAQPMHSAPTTDLPRRRADGAPSVHIAEQTAPVVRALGSSPDPSLRESTAIVPAPDSRRGDRLGLLFFLAGLGALIGAIAYAVSLLAGDGGVANVHIKTDPPGASVFLDGHDIGARTPLTIPSVAVGRRHEVELRLDGFPAHKATVVAERKNADVEVAWTFPRPAEAPQDPPSEDAPRASPPP